MEDIILDIRNIEKRMDNFSLKDISFTLPKGYIMGLVGKNGAGKTTLLQLLFAQRLWDKGEIFIDGISIKEQPALCKKFMGYVGEDHCFLEKESLLENKKLYEKFYEDFQSDLFFQYLKRFHLPEKKPLGQLSKGMQIKFQLAFALSHRPKLYVMDEPTAGLDPVFRKEFLYLLQEEVEREESSILIATHVVKDLDKAADYITILDQGKLLESKTKEELFDDYFFKNGQVTDLEEILYELLTAGRKGNDEAGIKGI